MGGPRDDIQEAPGPSRPATPAIARLPVRDQDVLWEEFLAMARAVVESVTKGVEAVCEGRLDLIAEVKDAEQQSNREELRIEQGCLRILTRYEPVASDLRRLATMLKVSRDWERIADLAARIARRARKIARKSRDIAVPESLAALARDVIAQVRASYEVMASRDTDRARSIIDGDRAIDRSHRRVRKELKDSVRLDPTRLDGWLQLLGAARNLERIADHASDIAETIVYLEEGTFLRRNFAMPAPPQ